MVKEGIMSRYFGNETSISRRSFLMGAGMIGLGLGLSACSGSNDAASAAVTSGSATSGSSASSTSTASGSTSGSSTTLVAYYSAQGHTERVAQELANDLDADLFEIVPSTPYSDEDLDFNDESSRVVQEYQNEDQRDTELVQNAPDNFADYDTVLVGYPIWWGDSAWAMRHFASENDFTGKTVIPFCTSLSSGLGQSGANLAELAGTGDWQDGQRFSQSVDMSDVQSWAQGLLA